MRDDVLIDDLAVFPHDPRQGDVGQVARSLLRNGQYRPVVVNVKTMQVLVGNTTVLAAKSLGWHSVEVVYVEVDAEEAARIVLADNRTADLAGYDGETLADLLAGLEDLDGTGFDGDDLDDLIAEVDAPRRRPPAPTEKVRVGQWSIPLEPDAFAAWWTPLGATDEERAAELCRRLGLPVGLVST